MSAVARLFLRAKHWQLFILLVGPCIAAQMVIMNSIAAARSPADFETTTRVFGAVTVIFALCFLGWIWSMGSFLNSLALESLRLRLRLFRFAVIYPPVYMGVFFTALDSARGSAIPALIVPFHLLAMFCMFYNLYFVSKSLVLAETNKPASFYDYAGPFFLLWFFPIGVWVIQPRINRLYALQGSAIAGQSAA